jgi:hypothetical protein
VVFDNAIDTRAETPPRAGAPSEPNCQIGTLLPGNPFEPSGRLTAGPNELG